MSGRFNVTKKGYDISEVDKYIDKLERTIEDYKDKDAAIKNAIINSQIAADSIIEKANIEAGKITINALRQVSDIQNSIASQKRFIGEFAEDYMAFVKRYINEFNEVNLEKINSKVQALEDYLASLKDAHIPKDEAAEAENQQNV